MTLQGRVALVTGSSRGIGAEIARLFAREGATVAVHGRDAAAIASVAGEIKTAGGACTEVTGDVTRFDDVETIRRRVEQTLGPIDILVANAGANLTPPHLPIEQIPEDGWRASVDTNLTATFLCIKSVIPGMKERRRGSIVTMSSAAARRPTAMSPVPYAVAKAGIQSLTQLVAAQAGPFGIRANCIAPETILTEDNAAQIPRDVQAKLVDEHPVRRLGTPDDVAQAALHLASDSAERAARSSSGIPERHCAIPHAPR